MRQTHRSKLPRPFSCSRNHHAFYMWRIADFLIFLPLVILLGICCSRIHRLRARTCRFRNLDSCVSMVQAAEDWMRDSVSEALDRACAGQILPERNVSPYFVVIGGVPRKNSLKVLGVENDQLIRALASDRPDQTFNISILPGRAERNGSVPDTHRSHAILERDAKCSVIVAHEISRRPVPRKLQVGLAFRVRRVTFINRRKYLSGSEDRKSQRFSP